MTLSKIRADSIRSTRASARNNPQEVDEHAE
jgi:hypothetical protein